MYNPYKYVFNRLNKLNKTIENLVNENLALREANDKLRTNEATYISRLAAWERLNPTPPETDILSNVSG